MLHKPYQLFFSTLIENPEHPVQLTGCLRMQQVMAAPMLKVFQRIMLRVCFFVVVLGGTDPVHQHFCYVFPGHPDGLQRISVL